MLTRGKKVSKDITELKRIADDFNFADVIRDYRLQYSKSEEEAHAVLKELKKWLILCSLNRENNYTMIGEVDDLWHVFILHTISYTEFCELLAGEYIHHVPDLRQREKVRAQKEAKTETLTGENKLTSLVLDEEVILGYQNLLDDMARHFDEGFNEDIWARIQDGMPTCPPGGCCRQQCFGGGACKTNTLNRQVSPGSR